MMAKIFSFAAVLVCSLALAACAAPKGEPEAPPAAVAVANVHAACTTCHYTSSPSAKNPGLRAQAQPLTATDPGMVTIDTISRLYEPVRFDHQVHAAMSNMGRGCVDCHHETPVVGEKPACTECHSPDSTSASPLQPSLKGAYHQQCLGCHIQWSAGNDCDSCHAPKSAEASNLAGQSGRAQMPLPELSNPKTVVVTTTFNNTKVSFSHEKHTSRFSLACAQCHKAERCSICHTSTGQPSQAVGHTGSLHDTCLPCHRQMACNDCHKASA